MQGPEPPLAAGAVLIRATGGLPLPGILPGGQAHERADGNADEQAGERFVGGGSAEGEADGRAKEHSDPQGFVPHSIRLASIAKPARASGPGRGNADRTPPE